jgi:hypothetical protein
LPDGNVVAVKRAKKVVLLLPHVLLLIKLHWLFSFMGFFSILS